MLNDLKELLASLSGGRPLVVALLVIAICFLLLRPRRKQPSPPAAAAGAGSSGAAGAPQQKLPALSLSTCDILLEFVNGAPRLKQERRARTRRRPAELAYLGRRLGCWLWAAIHLPFISTTSPRNLAYISPAAPGRLSRAPGPAASPAPGPAPPPARRLSPTSLADVPFL